MSCRFPTRPETLANVKGASYSIDSQGRYKVVDNATRAHVATLNTVEELRTFLTGLAPKVMPDLDGALPTAFNGTAANASPLRIQDQLTGVRKFLALAQVGPGAIITPIKQIAQNVEKLGRGKAFTQVYETTQKAMRLVDESLARTKRAVLGGKSYQDALHGLNNAVLKLEPEQQRLITLLGEAFTKEELERPGVLLAKGMSGEEIGYANIFAELGVAENLPAYVRLNTVIDKFVTDRKSVVEGLIPQLEVEILEGRLPPENQTFLNALLTFAGKSESWEDVVKDLALPDNEKQALFLLRSVLRRDDLNIPAIYRHSAAPKLEAGFKNGREQFIKQRGMKPEAVALADIREKILDEAFVNHAPGFSRAQILGAQLPIFRQFADVGIFAAEAGKPRNAASKVLDALEEGRAVLSRRVISGHLNTHELNPHVSAFKHVRNLLMREHYDPVSKTAVDEVNRIAKIDDRMGRIFTDYLHEIEGHPTKSFEALNGAIRTVGRYVGVKVDDRFAEKIVNTLSKLAYQASIPFRPALVLRNFTQTAFFTAPVVGPKAWFHGLEYVTNPKTMKEAFEAAVKGGAIDPNVVPLFGGTEIFGVETASLTGKLNPKIQSLGATMEDLFDKGFSIYRSADDWGRAVAFHSGRKRVKDALGAYVKDQSEAGLEKFKIASKVKTFDETIEAEFERLVRSDDFEGAANLIGKQLADKTHLLYGHANHPAGWGGVGGRLFGQFGTFPVQYANYVVENLSRGTLKDRAEFAAMHSAINMGVIVAGAEFFDVDLTSWATLPSLKYTGGPYADAFLNLAMAYGGSDAEKNLARSNLAMMFPTLEHPQSIFVPGSYFVGDLVDAMQETDLMKILGEGAGLRFLKSGEQNSVQKAFPWMF